MTKIISVDNLSKRYIIGHQHLKGRRTFREAIVQSVKNIGSRFKHSFSGNINPGSSLEEFWALRDINFEVEEGERIGIIGRNGAGKSTLLKVLSRITEPTTGNIVLNGRVASLLEVGTGFNGELTGRENIFLNGAILGMKREEIRRKFDEIVDFSGVEKFLDTPVKRYSSGMYVRLAFAVAAHLEPEILIVDEVLAVGDAEFQKKCLGKMQDVSLSEGRTVIFVSHNMGAIQALCNRVTVLDSGKIMFEGSTTEGINFYLNNNRTTSLARRLFERTDRQGNGKLRAIDLYIEDNEGIRTQQLLSGETYLVKLEYVKEHEGRLRNIYVSLDIHGENDWRYLMFANSFEDKLFNAENHEGVISCRIENFPLSTGRYYFTVFISFGGQSEILDSIVNASEFEVIGGDFFGTGSPGYPNNCKILHRSQWLYS